MLLGAAKLFTTSCRRGEHGIGQIETDKDQLPSDANTDSSASDEDFDGGNIKQSSEDKHPTEIQPDVVDGASGSQIKQRETILTPSFLQSLLEATEEEEVNDGITAVGFPTNFRTLNKRKEKVKKEKEHLKQLNVRGPVDPSFDPASIEAADWLILNKEPWSVVLEKWPLSFSVRQLYLGSGSLIPILFSSYPHYKLYHGYQLIDIDYKFLNIGAPNGVQKLESATAAISSFIAKKAADPSAVGLLKYLTNCDINQDTKLCAL
ncbi:uncharacterized protein LOC129728896 [Wyeomyia smithii]|uniref:uncharacterized protein LOC129728896 n=1 Tax=Wyeomyia smithii TaxID=174621 RepID=UPI002467BEBE|nr:uncharacterized protein LOC129728896 [Wyeomyia smithii]